MPGGKTPGPSIKNPATYEALKREGYDKTSAAKISNSALKKGYKKGVHHAHHDGKRRLAELIAKNSYNSRSRS